MSIESAEDRRPEMHQLAEDLAREVCTKINEQAQQVKTSVPLDYKAQCCLEMLIEILKARV